MARLESQIDMMHVPTPVAVLDRVARMLEPHKDGCTFIDTCCGDGTALASLASTFKRVRTFGVELDIRRAQSAQSRINKVLACSAMDIVVPPASMSLALLNPPYDESSYGRLERTFLEHVTPLLSIGGILVYVIAAKRFEWEIKKFLADHYSDFGFWSFHDPFYRGPTLAYEQTVLIARRTIGGGTLPSTVGEYSGYGHSYGTRYIKRPPQLPETPPQTWMVPPNKSPAFFNGESLTPARCRELLTLSKIPDVRDTALDIKAINPPMPLGTGHVALMLASGAINGLYGSGEDLHLSRGVVRRAVTTEFESGETAGGYAKVKKIERHTFAVSIRTLDVNGQLVNREIVNQSTDVEADDETKDKEKEES